MSDIVERLRRDGSQVLHEVVSAQLILSGLDIPKASKLADSISETIALNGLVIVRANQVIQQKGKVTVTHALIASVLEDAETWVTAEYVINDEIHPADRDRYIRDMGDIWKLKAELKEQTNG